MAMAMTPRITLLPALLLLAIIALSSLLTTIVLPNSTTTTTTTTTTTSNNLQPPAIEASESNNERRRRLASDESSSSGADHHHDLERVLRLATRPVEDAYTEDDAPFRVLFVVTTLAEYDKGTRGTTHGADRLKDMVLPLLVDGVTSMTARGWHVDVYLICGFETLPDSRESMIRDALPPHVGLEIWTDAIPLYYVKKHNGELKRVDPTVELAPHGLSRQHRFVVRDKLAEYDFFAAFEDDMRITAEHVVNFLEMSVEIDRARRRAEASPDGKVRVEEEEEDGSVVEDRRTTRGKSEDKARVGNDLVRDPMTAAELRRLWPGFVRTEVLDARGGEPHQLLSGAPSPLDRYKWMDDVPPSFEYEKTHGPIDPNACCGVPPGRARTPPHPRKDDLLLWETDVSAMGVRRYPGGVGWAAAMTVEDRADVGSYWSGEGHGYGDPAMKRPRRVNSLIGQQAGWMASRSQVLYFHEHACPGGFLPPFDGNEWVNDSLQTRNGAVEFWSGGYQLFGKCYFNRILSLDPKRFSRQLLYHASNNKQRTVSRGKFVRYTHFLGQLYTVKERALRSLMG